VVWRCVHSFGLGYILYRQSFDKGWIATYFEKGYTKRQAFRNWKKYATTPHTHTHTHDNTQHTQQTNSFWNSFPPAGSSTSRSR
jgi:hypothetical protein